MTTRGTNLLLRWLVMTALSIAVAVGCYGCGRAIDCAPGQVDGQCGLGTGMGEAAGVFIGAAIFLSATIYYAGEARKRRRVATQQTEPEGKSL
jgi:hypothetical protein